jgi:hypothetical protein
MPTLRRPIELNERPGPLRVALRIALIAALAVAAGSLLIAVIVVATVD